MALEFGLLEGLAQSGQYDEKINDARYHQQVNQQAKLMAEKKAAMFADDFDYNNAMNSHDNPLVKEFAQGKIKEIGSFVNQNPDWETNVMKRAQYKQMIHDLKDNPDLNRGLQSDANYAAYSKDLADVKYSNIDFKPVKQQWDNYIKYGNQNGEEAAKKDGKTAFVYSTPAPRQDTTKLLIDLAKDTQYDIQNNFGYQNSGLKQSVSNARKDLAVEHALASSWAPDLQKDYQAYLGGLQGQEKSNAKTINQFTRERMEPYFLANKIEKAYEVPVIKPPAAKGGSGSMTPSMWYEMHKKALKTVGSKIDFGSAAMDHTFANSYGEYNLDGVKTPSGDNIDLGLMKANSTGLVTVQKGLPGASPYAEHTVIARVPIDQFVGLGDKYDKIVDEEGLGQFTPGVSSKWDIRDEYKKDYSKYVDPKGKEYVQFAVKQKYDPSNPNLADNYANAHNISQHKEDPYEGITSDNSPTVSTQAEYDALPKGASYIDSAGNKGIKQ